MLRSIAFAACFISAVDCLGAAGFTITPAFILPAGMQIIAASMFAVAGFIILTCGTERRF